MVFNNGKGLITPVNTFIFNTLKFYQVIENIFVIQGLRVG